MSKIPRLDRNSSTGVTAKSAIVSKNSPTQGTKIPLSISPRKSSNNSSIPPHPNITGTLTQPVAPLQLDHADIRDISTPSHFHDNDSELDALSPLNSIEVPLAPSREEVELSLSPLQPETSDKTPDCTTPVSPPPHSFVSENNLEEIVGNVDMRVQDPSPIQRQSQSPAVHSPDPPLPAYPHTHSSPLPADYPVQTDLLYSPDVTLVPHPPTHRFSTTPPLAFSQFSPDLSNQHSLIRTRHYPVMSDSHFIPLTHHTLPPPSSEDMYTISSPSQWTASHPMLPPLPSPPPDTRTYYNLRASTDSPDLTSVSFGTPMDTPSPVPSFLSTPEGFILDPTAFGTFPADTDGLTQQLTALREALDESTRERARLMNIIQEQEYVRSPNTLPADYNTELERLRSKCMHLESENFTLNSVVARDQFENTATLQEATRARDTLATGFEQLKTYQLQLEEELRVERERNTLSPTSPTSRTPLLELETVKLDNTQLRDRITQLIEEQDKKVDLEHEVQSVKLELQEVEETSKLRLKENESYFLTQLDQEQEACKRIRQANKQLAQELNEQDSSKRIIQSELQSVREQKEKIEGELLSHQSIHSDLKMQLRGRDERLTELEMKQGQQVELVVLDTLKREIERLKVEKEGVELKLTQEMQQTLQYMEAKRAADGEINRLNRELQMVERQTERGNTQQLSEALEAAYETNQNLANELEMKQTTYEDLKGNLTRSVTDKRQLESDYSLLEQRFLQLNAFLETKQHDCLASEREVGNLQLDVTIAAEKVNSLEDSKQALSTLISLLSQIISELASAVEFSQTDHQSLTQEIESLFDEVSCSSVSEDSTPQSFENLRSIIQRQGMKVQQLLANQALLESYTEEVSVLKIQLQELEEDKLKAEENILELLANNASLQTKVNFNTPHTNRSEPLSLSQILPVDVFSLVKQNPRLKEQEILQSQLELTGQASPLPDTPPDYFGGEMKEMRRELRESLSLVVNLKQDLVKSHGCIVSLQAVNGDVTLNSNALERRAESVERELQTMCGEIENSKIERIHSSAQRMDRINMLDQVLESVCHRITQDNEVFCSELSKLARVEEITELSGVLQECGSETDTPQLISLVDTVLNSRQNVVINLLKRATQVSELSRQLTGERAELSAVRNESESDKVKLAELSELKNSIDKILSVEKHNSTRLVSELTSSQDARKLLGDELKDRERIVLSLRHELEQERFLHEQQSSEKETSLISQLDELKENNTQLNRDCELLNNRMQHYQITSSNQVEQLNAELCQTRTEVTRLEGVSSKLSETMKQDTNALTQLSNSQASQIEALNLELTQNKTQLNIRQSELQSQRSSLEDKEQMLSALVRDLDESRENKQVLLSQYEGVQEKKLSEATQRIEQLEHQITGLSEENSRLKVTFETELPSILEGNNEERTKLQQIIEDLSDKNGQLSQSLAEHKTELSRSKQELSRLTSSSEEQFESVLRHKRDLEEELGKLKQEYTLDIISLQGEIPTELLGEELDFYSRDSEHISLPNLIRKLCQENKELKARYHDLETSILEGRTDSLPGTSTPELHDHSDIVYLKKSSYAYSDAKPSDKLLRTKKKQLELLRLKLGYTLRELRMYKVLKSAYDVQIDDLKRLLAESGDKYEGCIQKITELEQLCF